jgi:hypothetical protein
MTSHDPRFHRKALSLCLVGMFSLAVLGVESKSGSARSDQQTPSKDFGRPVSIETGTEIYPRHQGFLQCAVDQLTPEFRHGHTNELFDNLNKQPSAGDRAVSVGHGAPGLQCTGQADNCAGTDNSILMADFNNQYWEPMASKIKGKYHGMTLLGCQVGQGSAGADFLFQMAKATQCPVRAPDSLIFCGPDGIFFDEGGTWVEATPQSRPTPRPPKRYQVKQTETFKFWIDQNVLTFKTNDVQSLQFEHRSYRQRDFATLPLEAAELLRMVGFSEPLQIKGSPAAVVTGVFRLSLKTSNNVVRKTLVLYNDALVGDLENQQVFYRVDSVRLADYIARMTK